MDIWKWILDVDKELIHQGNYRLANLMRMLPHHTVEENHSQVDAMVPEALALARAIKNPWIEVYIRHWNLQSRAAHRYEVTDMLAEAVNLLEFCHREETRDCPQSVCVVQDIDICYGLADGPGYVEERLAVAKETLDKIDTSWACFTCISGEYASALLDGKRYEEALRFLEQQTQALLLANMHNKRFSIRDAWVETLIKLQRYEEADAFNQESYSHNGGGESSQIEKDLDKARINAYLGRYDDAKQALPEFDKIIKSLQHCLHWAEATRLLVEAEIIPNDWHLNVKFQQMSEQLSRNGVIRKAFTIGLWQAELALKRGHPNTASRCCDRAQALIPRLRQALDAPQLLEEMRANIAQHRRENEPSGFEKRGLLSTLEEPNQVQEQLGDDPEINLDILEEARKRWAESEEIVIFTAEAYEKLGESQYGLERLSEYLETYPDSPGAVSEYGLLLFNHGQREALQNFATAQLKRHLSEQVHYSCHILLASQYEKDDEFEQAKPHLYALLETEPDDITARKKLAKMERHTGNLEAALQHLDRLVEMSAESSIDWDRMVVATLLEDWNKVRHSAERLGFEDLPTEGPIEEKMGLCRIHFREADGELVTYYAMRTGPVTARIVEIASPSHSQHYNDTVVFEPVRLHEPNESDEEAEHPLYASIQESKTGGYISYILDGVHPGNENWLVLKNALKGLGCECQIQSGKAYQLQLDEDSEPLLGVYAYIAVPENQPLQEVADLLAATTQNYVHPLIWPDMVEKLGDKDELERQRRIEEEYGF
jgi:tetratricopeptide (TPR) repeat protein